MKLHVSVHEDEGYALAALGMACVGARERERGSLSAEDLVAAFIRQRDLLSALRAPGEARRFELRTIVSPAPSQPSRGTIALYLLVRADGATAARAHAAVLDAIADLSSLLRGLGDEYDIYPVEEPEELAHALCPFGLEHVAEIRRRETLIEAGSLFWKEPRRVGFSAPLAPRAGAGAGAGEDAVYHVYPLVSRAQNLYGLYRTLLAQAAPLVLSAQLEPTSLTHDERQAMREALVRAERWLLASEASCGPNDERPPRKAVEAIAAARFAQLGALEDGAFAVRVRVASPLPLRASVVEAVAQQLSAPSTTSWSDPTATLRGGTDWEFTAGDDLVRAREELTNLGADARESRSAPAAERRLVGLFDASEAQSAFRLPVPDIHELPGVPTRFARFVSPPRDVPSMGVLIGRSADPAEPQEVRIQTDDRRRHAYIVGQSGTGKSTLFLGMALDDIRSGAGVCVIDPHGDLIEEILARYPKERAEDLVLLDAGDRERPVGINPLECSTQDERHFIVQEIVAMMFRLFPPAMIGPIFERNLRNALLTLTANSDMLGTLIEVPRLWLEKDLHKKYLPHVREPHVRSYWLDEVAKTSDFHRSEMIGYVTSKFERFVVDPVMRNIIGQQRSTIHFRSIMDEGKVLLVDLSKGSIGELNSALLGMLIVAKLQAAAMSRAEVGQEERRDFFLYVDEFQCLATETFASLLSEARKFRLNLVLTNQFMMQLPKDVIHAVLGNVGTLMAMRVGVQDATNLESQFAPAFRASDLLTLPNWHAYVNMLVDGQRVRPFSMRTVKDGAAPSAQIATAVRQLSRLKHGRDREIVESEIRSRWVG